MNDRIGSILSEIKQKPQRQDSLLDQLRDLKLVAARLGMYDAADFLERRIIFQQWERNKYLYPDRFDCNGPFWQAHCHWCNSLSDCYDTPEESSAWETDHQCSVVVPVESQ